MEKLVNKGSVNKKQRDKYMRNFESFGMPETSEKTDDSKKNPNSKLISDLP